MQDAIANNAVRAAERLVRILSREEIARLAIGIGLSADSEVGDIDASGETLHLGTTFYASQCGGVVNR